MGVFVACNPSLPKPSVTIPAQYIYGDNFSQDTLGIDREWWRIFGDDYLNALESQALSNNCEIEVALSRVEQARLQLEITRSEFLPSFVAGVSVDGEYDNVDKYTINYEIGPSLSWEFGMAGRLKHSLGAARAAIIGSKWAYRGVVLAITAATNRAKRTEEPTQAPGSTTSPITQPSPEGPDDNKDQPTAGTVPEMSAPVAGKLSKAHSVDVQVFSETMKDYRVHLGIDIHTEAGAQVFAAADGKVSKIWQDPMMGWCIALSHSGECVTVYKNLAKELADGLAEGVAVKKGQLLGQVGDSALMEIADEPHLHMEMTVKGLQVDPMDYFSQAVIASLSKDTAFEDTMGK
jgi:murein DD-endopeptidase MepM/ murein hydrolase activator NlpD